MKKKLLLPFIGLFFIFNAHSQDTVAVVGQTYVPVEGRGETPDKLEGSWLLKSGVAPANKARSKEVYKKKPAPGTELGKSSTTRNETVGGVTTTTTETEVRKVLTKEKQITPPQKEVMHKPQPPSISFFGANHTFTGFTGCNKFAGRYTAEGRQINIIAANPSTRMQCIGDYDEADFLQKVKKVNAYRMINDELQLLDGDRVLLVLSRK